MTVYIESIFIDNACVTAFASIIAYRFSCYSVKKVRTFIASLLSGIIALIYPLMPKYLSVAVKFLLPIFLGLILFYKNSLIKSTVIFVLTTFLYGGIVFAIGYFRYADVVKAVSYAPKFIPSVAILIVVAFTPLILTAIKQRVRKVTSQQFVYPVKICINEKTVDLMGFLDSGNQLYDTISGLPVVIVPLYAVAPYLTDEQLLSVVGANKKIRRIRTHGVGGAKDIPLIKPQSFSVINADKTNILLEVMVGLSAKPLRVQGCDVILPPSILLRR